MPIDDEWSWDIDDEQNNRRATKDDPNAEGHCTKCIYVSACKLYKEAYGERDMPILRK